MPLRLPIAPVQRLLGRIAWGWLVIATAPAHADDQGALETVTITAERPSAGAEVAPEPG